MPETMSVSQEARQSMNHTHNRDCIYMICRNRSLSSKLSERFAFLGALEGLGLSRQRLQPVCMLRKSVLTLELR